MVTLHADTQIQEGEGSKMTSVCARHGVLLWDHNLQVYDGNKSREGRGKGTFSERIQF